MTQDFVPCSDSDQVVDVAGVLTQLGAIGRETPDEVPLDNSIADGFLAKVDNQEKVAVCVGLLFPKTIPVDSSFFRTLTEIHCRIGVADSADEAVGRVWSEGMRRLPPKERQTLLKVYTSQNSHDFFENISSLHVVLKEHALPAAFLVEWFVELLQAVERDLMQDGVWRAIKTVCKCHPDDAIETLQQFLESPDSRQCDVAAFMLGTLRLASLTDKQEERFSGIESAFDKHTECRLCEVFNWSWVTTAQMRELSKEQLESLLSRAEISPDDLDNIVCVASRLIYIGCLSSERTQECMNWVSKKVTSDLSSNAKYGVASAAKRLLRNKDKVQTEATHWIQAIQPVSEENIGTWEAISDCLCSMLKLDRDLCSEAFSKLCDSSAATIHHLMANRGLNRLVRDLANSDASELVGQLVLSVDTATRKLGLYLFDELEVKTLPESALRSHESILPRLLFYETQRTILKPTSIARILAALAPIAEIATDGFRDEFFDELRLQCHNFSGGCREELEAIASQEPLVIQALTEVTDYLSDLKLAHEEGINAMEVAGYRRAAHEHRRRFSRQVSEGAKSYSPLLSKLNHVSLLYGRSSSHFVDGQLSDAMPLARTSTSMEIPVVDFFDPEEMALRRIHASAAINLLVQQHSDDLEVSNGR